MLIANYLPKIEDVGYMETYMGWQLIYRAVGDVVALSEGLDAAEVAGRHTFTDPAQQIAYLEIRRNQARGRGTDEPLRAGGPGVSRSHAGGL